MAAIAGIPTQVALMLHHRDFPATDLASVQAVDHRRRARHPALVQEIRARLGVAVSTRYSCTEAGIGLGTDFGDPPEDAEVSVGRARAGVEVAVRDVATGSPVARGEVGEVGLRSPAVMSGYWRDPEATAAAFWPDGFVRTGDLGRLDDGRQVASRRPGQGDVRARWLQRVPDGGRGRAGHPPGRSRRWRWSPGPTT